MKRSKLSATEYIRSILAITAFFLILSAATPLILFLSLVTLGRAVNFIVETLAPLLVRPVLWIGGIRFKIIHHAEVMTHPAIYIINHNSTLDMLTLLALGLPRIRFVVKWEFQYNPLFLLLGKLTGQIFIQRGRTEKAIQQLQKNYKRITENKLSVLMAPEGSRKHPGIIGPFKKGPFRMAVDLGYPIAPIYFEGSRKLSKGGSLFTKSGTVTAHIHRSIDTSGWTLNNIEDRIIDVRRQYLQWAGVKKDEIPPIAE